MGGSDDDIVIEVLSEPATFAADVASFDAAKARCFHDKDRQRLLAVIEAAFGTCAPFNKIVRSIFERNLRRDPVAERKIAGTYGGQFSLLQRNDRVLPVHTVGGKADSD